MRHDRPVELALVHLLLAHARSTLIGVDSGNRNYSGGYGGGINNYEGTVNLNKSKVLSNTAEANGGGIFNDNGTITLTNSVVSANAADGTAVGQTRIGAGGGIVSSGRKGKLTLLNSTVSDNQALSKAGGIDNDFGTLTLTNSTIAGNVSIGEGGGIDNEAGQATITFCTI